MHFPTFFSQQARKPTGWFGRWVMACIFDIGNTRLNRLVYDTLSPQAGDHILEIGCGTGKLLKKIAGKTDGCTVRGVDFSDTMVTIVRRKNKRHIAAGRVAIDQGDFDHMTFQAEKFTKICSVNTIYFWPDPVSTARKAARLLTPGGMFAVGYEDRAQLEKRRLDTGVFRLYSSFDVETHLNNAGFALGVSTKSICLGTSRYNCTVAIKESNDDRYSMRRSTCSRALHVAGN